MIQTAMTVAAVGAAVTQVAEKLPFPTELYSDMGGTFAPQLYFGSDIDASTDLPVNRAGIDPEEEDATWWVDFNMGERTEISTLGADADAADVATWITEVAR